MLLNIPLPDLPCVLVFLVTRNKKQKNIPPPPSLRYFLAVLTVVSASMEFNQTKFLTWVLVALHVFCKILFVRNQTMLDKSKNGLLNITVLCKHSLLF